MKLTRHEINPAAPKDRIEKSMGLFNIRSSTYVAVLLLALIFALTRCGEDAPNATPAAETPTTTPTPSGLACNPGKYSPDGETCLDCGVGRYTSVTQYGVSSCTLCAPGTFQSATGSSNCVNCAADFFEAFAGSAACTACPGGTHSPEGSTSCT